MDFNGVSVNELGSGRGPVATYAYGDGERTTSASTPKAASGRSRSWPDGKRRRQCEPGRPCPGWPPRTSWTRCPPMRPPHHATD